MHRLQGAAELGRRWRYRPRTWRPWPPRAPPGQPPAGRAHPAGKLRGGAAPQHAGHPGAGPAIAPSRPVAVSSSTLTQASRSRPSRDRGRTARAATGRRRPVPATRRCQGLAPGWPRSGPGPQSGGGSGRRHRLAGSPRPGGRGGAPGCIRPDDADKDVHGRSSRSTDRAVALWWELLLAGSFAHDELWEVRAVGAYRVLLVGLLRGLGGVHVQQAQQSGLQQWGLGDDGWVVAAGRDEQQAGQGLEDQPPDGLGWLAVVRGLQRSSNPACAKPYPSLLVTPCAQPWISPTRHLP